jgi:hypothetical protein
MVIVSRGAKARVFARFIYGLNSYGKRVISRSVAALSG